MKILVIKGSPHKNGSSNLLAEQFEQGAKEAGHEVVEFDTARAKIAPCIACDYCHKAETEGSCCQKDDMKILKKEVIEADVLVFATPVYWHSTSAQIKLAIDRMYAFYNQISEGKKIVLLAAANNPNAHIMDPLVMTYKDICHSLKGENAGMVLAFHCGTREETEQSKYPEEAYELGKNIEK
ncbi:MAG: flavodoxin family protein [Lachnospiraceae bacterium]|nr:flavodoxin family protein [Lachnospiraceae bacterium]